MFGIRLIAWYVASAYIFVRLLVYLAQNRGEIFGSRTAYFLEI